jgi:hypothetical protein
VLPVYVFVRVLVGAFIFQTGYGHLRYFLVSGMDTARVMQVRIHARARACVCVCLTALNYSSACLRGSHIVQ